MLRTQPEMITVLANNGMFKHVEVLHSSLKMKTGHGLNPEIKAFNILQNFD